MKYKKLKKILAIDPGYKTLGYAAFEDRQLVDHGVKLIESKTFAGALSQIEKILNRFITEKKPRIVVYEKNQFSQILLNYRVTQVCARIESICKSQGLPVVAISARTVRKKVTGDGNATKMELAASVAKNLPETKIFLKGRNKTQERYFQNAFDAIACGLAYLRSADNMASSRNWRFRLGSKQ